MMNVGAGPENSIWRYVDEAKNGAQRLQDKHLASVKLGQDARQFDATHKLQSKKLNSDLAMREQLMAFLGLTGAKQPGGPDGGPKNHTLFRELLGRQDSSRNEAIGLVDGFGESYRADVNDRYDTSLNNAMGSLESRGLGSSSLAGVAASANQRDRGRELLSLEDQLLGKRLQARQGADAMISDSFRTQIGADNNTFNSLLGLLR